MPLVNALLVALKEECFYLTEPLSVAADGLRESYLELGTVDDRDLAIEVATAVLAVQSQRRLATVLDPLPRYAPDGFITYGLGDTITALDDARVVGLTIDQDSEGRASVIPELKDRVAVAQEEVDRLLRRLTDGGLRGKTEQSSRAEPSPVLARPGRVYAWQVFSYDGDLVPGLVSPPWNPPVPSQLTQIVVDLRVAGSSNTGIRYVDQDGNVRASATVPAGRTLWAEDVYPPAYVGPWNQIRVEVTTAGTGASGLVVQGHAVTA